jgi:hypothetical protein
MFAADQSSSGFWCELERYRGALVCGVTLLVLPLSAAGPRTFKADTSSERVPGKLDTESLMRVALLFAEPGSERVAGGGMRASA